ncbi:MAG: stage II sporulation protein M [Bacteroidales bacterium]
MKEVVFIKRNIDRWNKFEALIETKTGEDPDTLASMFIQITDDLAYSRTFYPNSDTTRYLNQLAANTHLKIYKNKKEDRSMIKKFWKEDFPLVIYQSHKFIFISIVCFIVAVAIGAFSASEDVDFVRLILGDDYVDMTLQNIEKGDPMAVYKQAFEVDMFLGITLNNIRVSFYAFVWGMLGSVGTILVLLFNGIMLGSFQYFFFEHGLMLESVLTIWIHGTLEIFAIIVAGAAGLILGSSFLFPATFSRLYSFKKGATRGLRIIIGIMPLFIVAGFLEGFVTRHTEAPYVLRAGIILASLAFIIWYFYFYPIKIAKKFKESA